MGEAEDIARALGDAAPDESHIRERGVSRRDTLPSVMTFNADEAERLWVELARLETQLQEALRKGERRDSQIALLRAQSEHTQRLVMGLQESVQAYQAAMKLATQEVLDAVGEIRSRRGP